MAQSETMHTCTTQCVCLLFELETDFDRDILRIDHLYMTDESYMCQSVDPAM